MLINGWVVALTVSSLGILFLGLLALLSGFRVLRFWDHSEDTVRQLRLENEIVLTSALLQYGLGFQLLTLILLVLAADSFSSILVGAMCATGAFMANDYGMYTLVMKICMVFLCGYWLLVHKLDMCSESYPLVKTKYKYLIVVVSLLLIDSSFQTLYLLNLEPDVITSCCGVLFRPAAGDGYNLLDPFSTPLLLCALYGLALLLIISGLRMIRQLRSGAGQLGGSLVWFHSVGWLLFFCLAIWSVTVVFSSYIYAMPSHRCPFDILQAEYGYIGYPIYFTLITATFLGTGSGVAHMVRNGEGLSEYVHLFQKKALSYGLVLLFLFLTLTAYAPVRYIIGGGEF